MFSCDFASIARILLIVLIFASIFRFTSICVLPLFCYGSALILKRLFSDAQFRVDPVNLFSRDFASIASI